MVKAGGGKFSRGLRPGQPKIRQPGILFSSLSLPINEITRDKVTSWLKKEVQKRPTRTRLALSLLKAFIAWVSDQPKYNALVDLNACDRLTGV
jgi:hypothetical protein